jgi:hypothetical protein
MHSVLMLGARQSIQCGARRVLGQATCPRCSVLSGVRALSAADCSQMISAHRKPVQERWGGGGVQVIGHALSIWGINKQSTSIPKPTPPNRTDGGGARSQSAGSQCSVLRASPSIKCSVLNAPARQECT